MPLRKPPSALWIPRASTEPRSRRRSRGRRRNPGSPASGCGSLRKRATSAASSASVGASANAGWVTSTTGSSISSLAPIWPAGPRCPRAYETPGFLFFSCRMLTQDQYTRSRAASVARLTMTSDAKPAGRPRRRVVRARCRRRLRDGAHHLSARDGARAAGLFGRRRGGVVPAPRRRAPGAGDPLLRERRRALERRLRRRRAERRLALSLQRRTQLARRAVGRRRARPVDDRSLRRPHEPGRAGGARPDQLRHHQAGFARSDPRPRDARGGSARRSSRGSPTGARAWPAVTTPRGCASASGGSGSKTGVRRASSSSWTACASAPRASGTRTGRRRPTGSYVAGRRDGRWRFWDERGQLTADVFYRDGVRVSAPSGGGMLPHEP